MKIVIANGRHEADYIIRMFKDEKANIIVINSDKSFADYISKNDKLPVYVGDPYKRYVLEETHIENADIFVALSQKDADNFVACSLAKKLFAVKKTICLVQNPKNVDIFKRLGIDSVISSTYVLANSIKNESSLEEVIKTLSLEDDKIVLSEIVVSSKYKICDKTIAEVNFPKNVNISCVYRKPHVIIPNGSTRIMDKDKLIIVCAVNDQKSIIDFIKTSK